MDITNFTSATNVTFDTGTGSSFIKFADKLICGFGEYARVVEKPLYNEGDEVWGLVEFDVPNAFTTYAPRFITYDNYQQQPNTTTRIAVMAFKDGSIHLVSNRGQTLRELASTTNKLPFGKRVQLILHARLSSVNGSGLTELFVDGVPTLKSTMANIDKGTVIGRTRLGIDGAAGAVNKSATFYRMYSSSISPAPQTEKERLQALLITALIAEEKAYVLLNDAQKNYDIAHAEVLRIENLLSALQGAT